MPRLWNTCTGHDVKRSWGLETEVAALAWSGDGRLAVAAGAGVTIWDGNRAAAHLKGGDSFIRRMTWSPDGTRVAAGFAQGIVRVWDVGTGHEVFQTNVGPRWEPIDGLTWLDSEHLAVCNSRDDGRIHVLDLRDREPEAVLKTGAGWLPALAWHPSGNLAAACWTHTGEPQVTIRLWERNVDGSFPAEPAANWQASANVLPLAWSPDGRFLVGAGSDGSIEIWQTALRTRERLLDAHKGPVRDVAWAPDGSRLASVGDDGTLRIWEPLSGRLLATLTAAGDTTLAQTPGGYCVIEGDATRVRWALPHPEHPLSSLYVPLGGYRAVVVNPERVRAVLAGDLSNDDLNAELESRGWLRGLAWNGQRHLAPRRSPSDGAVDATDRPSACAATSVEAMKPLSVENPFLPGGPLRDDPNPPGAMRTCERSRRSLNSARLSRSWVRGGPARPRCSTPSAFGCDSRIEYATRAWRCANPEPPTHWPTHSDRTKPEGAARPILSTRPSPERKRKGQRPCFCSTKSATWQTRISRCSLGCAIGQEGLAGIVYVGTSRDWIKVVEAANRNPGSSFGNDVTPVTLGPINRDDARTFLTKTAPPDVPFEAERTAAWILDLCGTWPFYLQVLGFAVVHDVRTRTRRALVERERVHELYEQALLVERHALFRSRWDELTRPAQDALRGVRGKQPPPFSALAPAEQDELIACGLCDTLQRWIADPPFFDWIERQRDRL